jgi:hypothetical protein
MDDYFPQVYEPDGDGDTHVVDDEATQRRDNEMFDLMRQFIYDNLRGTEVWDLFYSQAIEDCDVGSVGKLLLHFYDDDYYPKCDEFVEDLERFYAESRPLCIARMNFEHLAECQRRLAELKESLKRPIFYMSVPFTPSRNPYDFVDYVCGVWAERDRMVVEQTREFVGDASVIVASYVNEREKFPEGWWQVCAEFVVCQCVGRNGGFTDDVLADKPGTWLSHLVLQYVDENYFKTNE